MRCFRPAALLSAVCVGIATAALAQAPAPRAIPDGFVLPGPPPTGTAPAAKPPASPPSNPALAAPEQHGSGDWPCMQRRVDRMDAAQIWPGLPETGETAGADAGSHQLVRDITQRRVPLAEAQERLRTYLDTVPRAARAERAAALFQDLLRVLNHERADVINGISRYAGKQKALARQIRAETARFDTLMRQATPDPQEVAQEQEALLWQTRLFDERRQSLTYVCEVPVLIEQRMFALGRVLRDAAGAVQAP